MTRLTHKKQKTKIKINILLPVSHLTSMQSHVNPSRTIITFTLTHLHKKDVSTRQGANIKNISSSTLPTIAKSNAFLKAALGL